MNEQDEPIFKCQNCQLPLNIDTSLLDLSLAQRNLIVNSTSCLPKSSIKIPNDRLQRLSKVNKYSDLKFQNANLGDSFVLLKDSTANGTQSFQSALDPYVSNMETSGDEQYSGTTVKQEYSTSKTLSTHVSVLSNLFNILSAKSSIDYPVCQDCCDWLIQRLKSQYDETIKERDTYNQFLNQLQEQKKVFDSNNNKSIDEEQKLIDEERDSLLKKLIKLEEEDERLDKEISSLEHRLEEKKLKEDIILENNNIKDLEGMQFAKEVQSLNNQYESALNRLDTLRKINIYNETFKISHEGPFGTINGLRLGGFDDVPVPWDEINAALGQVILLLATISTRLNFKLDGYRLQPMGSFSKIAKFDNDTQDWIALEAYNDENFKVGRLFRRETNFDKSLECLLTIIHQLCVNLTNSNITESQLTTATSGNQEISSSQEIELPYEMIKDKINNISVKLFGSKPNLEWTTAMKLVLTNIKWLLAYSSSRLSRSTV
ncbi:hypothetical protein Kpol_479p11 [Vanderwaltozyma polyspora DSM 70294]|uniref:Uncharacterized protein n=1 Tax=Vanderwaltozyma polyspora (strain ATCC 22028 / DSM 70294 / BCRC 21397 / CBS 2163 / NBRC 10782 / NRRL Y-8283 / UCD 57-17) TaxID=436907 RepID=A7TQC4_VANPO|nr:uncharacterized protein Kpol_479p11 [Vanderwaltozyma polyspora DSM 70294]EDO15523.1 hypothetical protein Kpol_479p11 [Vanderwaltozyma polyspora DSM 70294]